MQRSNLIIILFSVGLFSFSCSSSKKSVANIDRSDVKGTWLLENITYEGLPQNQSLKLVLLDEGNADCLEGSTWVFPNNGYGSYSIASSRSGCTTGERSIVWSHRVENGQDILQFKKLTGGVKAKDVTEGYKFNIVSATDANLVLTSKVPYQGNTISISYNFSKK
jgi:hypothetical protein